MISYPAAHDLGIMVVGVLTVLLAVGIPCYLYVWVRSKLHPEWLTPSFEEQLRAYDQAEAERR